jgi:hypothetical protein
MNDLTLSPEQEQFAKDLFQRLQPLFLQEAQNLARLLASKPTDKLLGKTEFEMRDSVHKLAADTLASALAGRKKGATKGRA